MELAPYYNQDMGSIGQIITVLSQQPPEQATTIVKALHGALVDSDNGVYHRSILNAALKGDEALARSEIQRFRRDVEED